MKTFQQFLDTPITEGNKSGDSSLHDWFSKSKSSDGKPGWVQAGGRYAGKPCAKQPGQTSKPKCISSKMKRNMSKDEEQAAHRRKNREDPNPNRKGKAINVSTESVLTPGRNDYGLPPLKPGKKKPDEKPMKAPPYNMAKANEETEVDECWKTHKKVGMKKKGGKMVPDCRPKTSMGEAKKFGKDTKIPTKSITDPNVRDKNLTPGNPIEKKLKEACWKGYEKKGMKTMFGKRYPNCVKKTKKEDLEYATEAKVDQGRSDYGKASIRNYRRKGPGYGEPAMFDPENKRGKLIDKRREEHKARRGVKGAKVPAYKTEEAQLTETDKKGKGSGTKDACYHKVKSRYSVWPSAYASGALVKCRKVGAANWGNSSKKEEFSPLKEGISFGQFQEKCWPGYEKKGMKTMFGKRYPNCVKKTKSEEVEQVTEKHDTPKNVKGIAKELDKAVEMHKSQAKRLRKAGVSEGAELTKANINYKTTKKDGKTIYHVNKNDEADAQKALKNDPKYILGKTRVKPVKEGAAWTKKSGKNPSGGLNEKGRKSYERDNPGSDLKAPSKKVGNKRRASFCARMKGMKKKLTSSKTANDPDSRINKSLRAWNC